MNSFIKKGGWDGRNKRKHSNEESAPANSNFLYRIWPRGRLQIPQPNIGNEQRICKEGVWGQWCHIAGDLQEIKIVCSSFWKRETQMHWCQTIWIFNYFVNVCYVFWKYASSELFVRTADVKSKNLKKITICKYHIWGFA